VIATNTLAYYGTQVIHIQLLIFSNEFILTKKDLLLDLNNFKMFVFFEKFKFQELVSSLKTLN